MQQHRPGVPAPERAGADPRRARERGPRLAVHRLSGAWLSGARLSGARLSGARLGASRLGGARLRVLRVGRGGLSGFGLGQRWLHRQGAAAGEQLADHRLGHPEPLGDHLLAAALTGPGPRLGHLPLGQLGRAPAAAHQGSRPVRAGPPAQDRHVRRGQPEHRGDLIDASAGVGQRHDRQIAHPGVAGVVAVKQRASGGHQDVAVAGMQPQHARFRHPLQRGLTHAESLPHFLSDFR
ncbi:MAG: pentapeptide repeat-containing protein [Dermatophilaceae bacterium]